MRFTIMLDKEDMELLLGALHTEYNHIDAIRRSCKNDPMMRNGMVASEKQKRVWELYGTFAEMIRKAQNED